MAPTAETTSMLVGPNDEAPVEILRPDAPSPWFLVCEHAGRAVPAALGDLGVAAADWERHIAFDVGARSLTSRLAALLDAAAVLQPYSRLVIDCNRPIGATDLIPPVSDGTAVPANANLAGSERAARVAAIHAPFHAAIKGLLDARSGPTAIMAVHSFTPRLRGGAPRPWHAGLCCRRPEGLAHPLLIELARAEPGLCLAVNQPYEIDDTGDYTIPTHAEARGLPHLLLEVRNDLIATAAGQARWADRLAAAMVRLSSEVRG